jgi:hypothetical protein
MKNLTFSLDRFVPDFLRCPSSPLPVMETPTGPICLPTYVGIAGGCDIDPQSQDYQPGLVAPTTSRLYQNEAKGTGAAAGGIVTSSGMLPPCEHVRLADCLDGTSNTMIVGEQSDWLLDQNQAKFQKYHGDPGWTVGGTGPGGGWLSGTTRVDPVPKLSTPADATGQARADPSGVVADLGAATSVERNLGRDGAELRPLVSAGNGAGGQSGGGSSTARSPLVAGGEPQPRRVRVKARDPQPTTA